MRKSKLPLGPAAGAVEPAHTAESWPGSPAPVTPGSSPAHGSVLNCSPGTHTAQTRRALLLPSSCSTAGIHIIFLFKENQHFQEPRGPDMCPSPQPGLWWGVRRAQNSWEPQRARATAPQSQSFNSVYSELSRSPVPQQGLHFCSLAGAERKALCDFRAAGDVGPPQLLPGTGWCWPHTPQKCILVPQRAARLAG